MEDFSVSKVVLERGKAYNIINIDESCENIISTTPIKLLNLQTNPHAKMSYWINSQFGNLANWNNTMFWVDHGSSRDMTWRQSIYICPSIMHICSKNSAVCTTNLQGFSPLLIPNGVLREIPDLPEMQRGRDRGYSVHPCGSPKHNDKLLDIQKEFYYLSAEKLFIYKGSSNQFTLTVSKFLGSFWKTQGRNLTPISIPKLKFNRTLNLG